MVAIKGLPCFAILTLSTLVSSLSDRLQIPAYEYLKRFSKPLNLGNCPARYVKFPVANVKTLCSLPSRKGRATYTNKLVHSQTNVVIGSAEELFQHVRLCDDNAAAYLGLLASGDCFASEIASKLTFRDKFVTRMYLEHLRPRVDKLEPSASLNVNSAYTWYFNNTYYTHNIGIGTDEILLVEMQFKNIKQAGKARYHKMKSKVMSDYLVYLGRRVGVPKKLKVIRLSTSDQDFQVKVFRGSSAYQDGLAYVKDCEAKTQQARRELMQGRRESHLQYNFKLWEVDLSPVAQAMSSISDADKRKQWEDVTLLQVKAKRVYVTFKRYRKHCRKSKLPGHKFCPLIRDSLKKVRIIVKGLLKKRLEWTQNGYDYQTKFIAKGRSAVTSLQARLQVATDALRKSIKVNKKRRG